MHLCTRGVRASGILSANQTAGYWQLQTEAPIYNLGNMLESHTAEKLKKKQRWGDVTVIAYHKEATSKSLPLKS